MGPWYKDKWRRVSMENRWRVRAVTVIDLIIHIMCLKTNFTIDRFLSWNGGGFIILGCLDDMFLLMGLETMNSCLMMLCKLVRVVYILTLLINWFVIGKDIYQERQHNGELALYLFIGSFSMLVLPFLYIYYLGVIKSYRKDLMGLDGDQLDGTWMGPNLDGHVMIVIIMIFLHPIIFVTNLPLNIDNTPLFHPNHYSQ